MGVPLRFQEVLADECMKYLLRAKLIPINKTAKYVSSYIIVGIVLTLVGFQLKGLYIGEKSFEYLGTVSGVGFCIMYWLCYQHDEAPWRKGPHEQGYYLWVVAMKEPPVIEVSD